MSTFWTDRDRILVAEGVLFRVKECAENANSCQMDASDWTNGVSRMSVSLPNNNNNVLKGEFGISMDSQLPDLLEDRSINANVTMASLVVVGLARPA